MNHNKFVIPCFTRNPAKTISRALHDTGYQLSLV